jgi:hypothetical protein
VVSFCGTELCFLTSMAEDIILLTMVTTFGSAASASSSEHLALLRFESFCAALALLRRSGTLAGDPRFSSFTDGTRIQVSA